MHFYCWPRKWASGCSKYLFYGQHVVCVHYYYSLKGCFIGRKTFSYSIRSLKSKSNKSTQIKFGSHFLWLCRRGHLLVLWEFQGSKGMLGYEWKLGTQDFMFLYIHCCFKRSFVGRLTFYFPSFPIVLLHNVLKYRREIKRKRYAILKLDYFPLPKCSLLSWVTIIIMTSIEGVWFSSPFIVSTIIVLKNKAN